MGRYHSSHRSDRRERLARIHENYMNERRKLENADIEGMADQTKKIVND